MTLAAPIAYHAAFPPYCMELSQRWGPEESRVRWGGHHVFFLASDKLCSKNVRCISIRRRGVVCGDPWGLDPTSQSQKMRGEDDQTQPPQPLLTLTVPVRPISVEPRYGTSKRWKFGRTGKDGKNGKMELDTNPTSRKSVFGKRAVQGQ